MLLKQAIEEARAADARDVEAFGGHLEESRGGLRGAVRPTFDRFHVGTK